MQLSQTGLTFTAVQNGGAVAPQTFRVLNLGSGAVNWTTRTSVLGGTANWLMASPSSGTSYAANAGGAAPAVTVSVNPAGLASGVYYGLVTVTAPGAANTPQGVVVALQVLAQGSDTPATPTPNTLAFTAAEGGWSPGSQTVSVYDPTGTQKSFRSVVTTASGGNWLLAIPGDAAIPMNGPAQTIVQPLVDNLNPGTYQATLTLQYSDGRISQIPIVFSVTGVGGFAANAAGRPRAADNGSNCMPTQLLPSLTTLGSGFNVPAGFAQGLEAQVRDDCGGAQVDGSVFVQFSDGEPPVKLTAVGNGLWQGTWVVGPAPQAIALTVVAQSAAALTGQSQLNGGANLSQPQPAISSDGVLGFATGIPGLPVAPGEWISINGSQLSGGAEQGTGNPLPVILSGTTIAVGSQSGGPAGQFVAVPLLAASGSLVNAVVPFGATANTRQQVILQWESAYANPVSVDVAPAAPGIFLNNGQAVVVDASGNPLGPTNPAHAGDVISIQCTGLGAVSAPLSDGAATPSGSTFAPLNPVSVTVGGQKAAVSSAALVPGMVGVFQVTVTAPSGVTPGDAVPIVISAAGQNSPPAGISMR